MTHQDFIHLAIIYRGNPAKLEQVTNLMVDYLSNMVCALAWVGDWSWEDIANAGLEATYDYIGRVGQALPRGQA